MECIVVPIVTSYYLLSTPNKLIITVTSNFKWSHALTVQDNVQTPCKTKTNFSIYFNNNVNLKR